LSDNDNQITQLVEQALTGHKTSLEQLLEHFYKDIFRMVYYRLPSRMDAEDLTQEIFMQMIKSLPTLKDSRLLKPWLFRIALNRIRDFYRKKRILSFFGSTVEKDVDLPVKADSYSDPLKNILHKEFQLQLRKFSESLSRREREVFTLRFLDQLEIKEIVQILQKNENTVKTHLYRALKKFRGNAELYSLLSGE
jgi:RNA polymerase sigma-70 factor (ECF subfamily)